MESSRTIIGIDFSGAAKAGRKIWITSATYDQEGLHVNDCIQGKDLLTSAINLNACLSALVAFISRQNGAAVVGIDFPFSIPQKLIPNGTSWQDFVKSFPERYKTADAFKNLCWEDAGQRELKRTTDEESKTPFSAYNLRLYKQTYHGINGVLRPLLIPGGAWIAPMQDAIPGRPVILEICPASTLKNLGLPSQGYKGKGDEKKEVRKQIVGELSGKGYVQSIASDAALRIETDTEGDALDSLVACVAAARANVAPAPIGSPYRIEGYVYV